jgi:hypothetical protein
MRYSVQPNRPSSSTSLPHEVHPLGLEPDVLGVDAARIVAEVADFVPLELPLLCLPQRLDIHARGEMMQVQLRRGGLPLRPGLGRVGERVECFMDLAPGEVGEERVTREEGGGREPRVSDVDGRAPT